MARCVIFCAALCQGPVLPPEPGDYVIAADGGLAHAVKFGISPDEILGDFDSLGYTPADARVFPVEKDDTDTMLAIKRGLALGYREFLLYGSLDGPRLDHTVANFQALQYLCDHGAFGYLIGNRQMVTVVKNGTLRFPEQAAGTVSVFCLGPDARGVTLEGLYYPMENGTLTPGFPLGVSNHFTGQAAAISVREGSLLVIWDRENRLPERMEF